MLRPMKQLILPLVLTSSLALCGCPSEEKPTPAASAAEESGDAAEEATDEADDAGEDGLEAAEGAREAGQEGADKAHNKLDQVLGH